MISDRLGDGKTGVLNVSFIVIVSHSIRLESTGAHQQLIVTSSLPSIQAVIDPGNTRSKLGSMLNSSPACRARPYSGAGASWIPSMPKKIEGVDGGRYVSLNVN